MRKYKPLKQLHTVVLIVTGESFLDEKAAISDVLLLGVKRTWLTLDSWNEFSQINRSQEFYFSH